MCLCVCEREREEGRERERERGGKERERGGEEREKERLLYRILSDRQKIKSSLLFSTADAAIIYRESFSLKIDDFIIFINL